MSTFIAKTKHPETGKWEWAEWIDNHFGRHQYGVLFLNDENVYDPRDTTLKTKETEEQPPKDVLQRLMGIEEEEPVACEEGTPSEPSEPVKIGDKVWTIKENAIVQVEIGAVCWNEGQYLFLPKSGIDKLFEKYANPLTSKLLHIPAIYAYQWIPESKLFPTREALLASL